MNSIHEPCCRKETARCHKISIDAECAGSCFSLLILSWPVFVDAEEHDST